MPFPNRTKTMKHIIITAHQASRHIFTGSLDDLTAIANSGNRRVYHLNDDEAARPANVEETEPSHPEGGGWYYDLGKDYGPELADSQLAAILAVLGYDSHYCRHFTEAEAREAIEKGIPGHFGTEARRMLISGLADD